MEVSSFFPSMFLSSDYHEDGQEFQVHHSSSYFFSGGFYSSFVDHIFSSFLMLSYVGAPLNHSLLAIHLFWSDDDISEDSSFPFSFHSSSFKDAISFKPF